MTTGICLFMQVIGKDALTAGQTRMTSVECILLTGRNMKTKKTVSRARFQG